MRLDGRLCVVFILLLILMLVPTSLSTVKGGRVLGGGKFSADADL